MSRAPPSIFAFEVVGRVEQVLSAGLALAARERAQVSAGARSYW